jgi:hypothetical protein
MQSGDVAWNTANCRNRRLFNDRVGLAAGRSTKKFLLQSYRRDMGGGRFVAMKDVSAPITVAGRHWGGRRIAYKTEKRPAERSSCKRLTRATRSPSCGPAAQRRCI